MRRKTKVVHLDDESHATAAAASAARDISIKEWVSHLIIAGVSDAEREKHNERHQPK